MIKYLLGILKNLFNPAVSVFTKIDHFSIVDKKAKIHRGAKIFNSTIGKYSYITNGCSIVYAEIGKFCSIGHCSNIGMGHHNLNMLSTSPIFNEKNNATGHRWTNTTPDYPFKKVIIGNDVWIGSRVMVMGGITIGDGAVIAAGAIVTKNIPDYAIAVGVPAKVIKYRFEKPIIEKLMELKWWNMAEEKLEEKIKIFQTDNFSLEDLKIIKNVGGE